MAARDVGLLVTVKRIVQRCPPETTDRHACVRQQRRRSQRARRWWLPLTSMVVLVAISAYPRATNHQVRIEEAMAGANGDSQIQFVEMRMLATIQNCWGPQVDDAITPGADTSDDDCFSVGANETRSRAMLVFSDAIGREVGRFKFPENPPSGSQRVLIATQAFADLAGAPTPDFIMPPLMNPVNGKVCFKGNGTENANAFFISLCLSYGNFTGSTEGAGAAAAALSVVNTVSLERQPGTFSNLNSQFSIQNTPTPTNFNGDTFTIPVASQATQGEALFNQETFGGNGRTCASCHVVSLNGGLNPANITTRFGTVSTTFDPLFVGETAATGFDFNLNTLTLTANSQHQSGTDFGNVSGGDLQGVITSPGLPKGKVLGRANGSYLIHGGFSPAVAGTVTDENGNQGTVNTVVQGGLNALETPSRMRTSASASFPQGRGLILGLLRRICGSLPSNLRGSDALVF